jgi:hypothetical protein
MTNPIISHAHFDSSDQGSVDSDYTSLDSSKFYGQHSSTSSLHRHGRSQSIDELATSTTTMTTSIPTRHFNGTLPVTKASVDPLQFVKIHPNQELIERAQEQLTLAQSRQRLQDTYKLNQQRKEKVNHYDDGNDWSKVTFVFFVRHFFRLMNVNGKSLYFVLTMLTRTIDVETTRI